MSIKLILCEDFWLKKYNVTFTSENHWAHNEFTYTIVGEESELHKVASEYFQGTYGGFKTQEEHKVLVDQVMNGHVGVAC